MDLNPSAAGLAGRGIKTARAGGNALGSHTASRHQFFDIPTLTFRTFRSQVLGRQHELFKAIAAGFTLVFEYGHGSNKLLLKIFIYNNV